jgi:cardiolipin synthase
MKNLPNLLSAMRLMLSPIIGWLVLNNFLNMAIFTILLAVITDILDGWLARRNDWGSGFGKILDPIADKCFIIGLFLALAIVKKISFWLLIFIWGREIFLMFGAAVLWTMRKHMLSHHWLSKINVGLQGVIGCLALLNCPLWIFNICVVMMIFTSLKSAFFYGYQSWRLLARTH